MASKLLASKSGGIQDLHLPGVHMTMVLQVFLHHTLLRRLVGEVAHLQGAHTTSWRKVGMLLFRCLYQFITRRAHLRTCMEALKERLVFDSEVPRITMLTVLRKATSTIQVRTLKTR